MSIADGKLHVTDVQAIGLAIAAFTFFLLGDTAIKLVGKSGLPPYETVAFLGLFMAMFVALFQFARRQGNRLRPHRVSRQIGRACLDLVNNLGVVVALRHLTLTVFYILVFLAPIVISLLSAIFLREHVSWKRAVAIAAGFAGVVIAVHPWSSAREADWIGFCACLVCVACFSTNMVWARVLTKTETPESLAFFSGLVTAVAGFTAMLFLPAVPVPARLILGFAAMGLFWTLGVLCFYTAVKYTSAANVSQYHYTQLVTGTAISYLIWHDKPSVYVVLGGILIMASGLYIALAAGSNEESATMEVQR